MVSFVGVDWWVECVGLIGLIGVRMWCSIGWWEVVFVCEVDFSDDLMS